MHKLLKSKNKISPLIYLNEYLITLQIYFEKIEKSTVIRSSTLKQNAFRRLPMNNLDVASILVFGTNFQRSKIVTE
jgi:hypothetical protein